MADDDLLERYKPQPIESAADPDPELLLDGRAAVMGNDETRRILREGRESGQDRGDLRDLLAMQLASHWQGEIGLDSCLEVATYLVDEYLTLGEGIFLVSRETGKIEAQLSEDDLYKPAPVPREDGTLAQPLARIRPDIQSNIAVWLHNREREKTILAELTRRANLTPLLEQEGDRRLQVATRHGRAQIVAEVAQEAPAALLGALSGPLGAFVRRFPVTATLPGKTEHLVPIEVETLARTRQGVQDPLTTNLSYSPKAQLRSALPAAWLRQVLKLFAERVHAHPDFSGSPPTPLDQLTRQDLGDADLWIVDPNLVRAFRDLDPNLVLIPIPGAPPLGIESGEVGCLQVPGEFSPASRELFDRWQVEAGLQVTIWYDPTLVNWVVVTDVPLQAQVV
jgi:hypothetical protein